MTSTLFAFAPAGSRGTGSVDARPYACTAVRPELRGVFLGASVLGVRAAEQGSGVPTAARAAGMAPRLRGWVAGTTGAPAAGGIHLQIDPITQNPITKNDGTTLGIHSPGRPLS